MGSDDLVFLSGLGVVYGVAFALTRNCSSCGHCLHASIAGFADVITAQASCRHAPRTRLGNSESVTPTWDNPQESSRHPNSLAGHPQVTSPERNILD